MSDMVSVTMTTEQWQRLQGETDGFVGMEDIADRLRAAVPVTEDKHRAAIVQQNGEWIPVVEGYEYAPQREPNP